MSIFMLLAMRRDRGGDTGLRRVRAIEIDTCIG
jgi:hypothetical protein